MVLAKPQPFDGTRVATVEAFDGQIGLHAVTYPEWFPTNASKVAFSVLFMRDYTATWSQPYLEKVFNREPVVFDDFLNNFRSVFFDHNCQHHAKVTLQNLCQTRTLLAYTHDFNQHACTMGWANTPLMSLYQHGLKENIHLSLVMSNVEFYSLQSMQVLALKAGQTIEKAPTIQLFDAKQARLVQPNLCFRCGQAGHVMIL
ncbi:uncharacterized protein VP01_8059g1 [Puccinia sorghi]|uniref:Retrotransposon gag domain-containing protein n=1 Tax=Puccinia sorghi TaxID=27349 RepID=A0A0L6UAG3_9BASI|nr:uncharacterized protein VP01_8059g1 [Puccinia sorghi]